MQFKHWLQSDILANWRLHEFQHAWLNCVVRLFERAGCWNGYVEIPKDSPLYGKHYSDHAFDTINVHGGLTFGGDLGKAMEYKRFEGGHWLGFDTAHAGDEGWIVGKRVFDDGIPRTFDYVLAETQRLAEQIKVLL